MRRVISNRRRAAQYRGDNRLCAVDDRAGSGVGREVEIDDVVNRVANPIGRVLDDGRCAEVGKLKVERRALASIQRIAAPSGTER